jgi:hypothetical protein
MLTRGNEQALKEAQFKYMQQKVGGPQVDYRALAIENLQKTANENMAPGMPGAQAPGADIQAELEATPGYQFQLAQSEKAIKRMASASGYRGSGKLYEQLLGNAAGMASTRFDTHLSQLFNLSGIGANAATQQGSAIQSGASAQQAGIIGSAGAKASMYNTLAQGVGQIAGSIWKDENPVVANANNASF